MYPYINNTLGLTVTAKMPFGTVEEYDRLSGQAGAGFEVICAQTCYGSFNAQFGKALSEKLVQVTGLPIPTTGSRVKTKDGEVDEVVKPKAYLAFLLAKGAVTAQQLGNVAQEVANAMPVIELGGSRGPAKPAKVFMDQALMTISTQQQKGRDIADWVAVVEANYPGVPAVSEEDGYDQTYVARVLQHATAAQAAVAASL